MLDWCRCVCKRAGQHQCFDSGSSAPIISPPAAEPLPPAACPYNPSPPSSDNHISRSPSSVSSLFLCSFFISGSRIFSVCPSTPVCVSVPLRHPLSLCHSLRDTIGLSLSSRGRNFLHTRVLLSLRALQPILIDMGFRLPLTTYVT